MLTSSWLALALTITAPTVDDTIAERAQELVGKLGDPSFRVREKAAHELLEIGYPARTAILAGQKSSDLEVSERCKKLYPAIWQRDMDRRIAKFLNAKEGTIPDDLPGAKRWLELIGDNKESRELYSVMVRSHTDTLLKAELQPEQAQQQYFDFVKNAYQKSVGAGVVSTTGRYNIAEPDVLIFLFLGALGDARPARIVVGTSPSYFTQFLNSTYLQEKLVENAALRKLFAGWLANERYALTLRRGIDLAAQHKVREAIPAVLSTAKDPATVVTARAMAILAFARLGTKDDLKELEPFLKDKTVISPAVILVGNERGSVEMRDVALGAAVQAMGQNLSDFGFERKPPVGAISSSYTYYAFGTDEKRDAAHKKWAEWLKNNLKK